MRRNRWLLVGPFACLFVWMGPSMASELAVVPGKSVEAHFPVQTVEDGIAKSLTMHALVFAPQSYAQRSNWPLLVFLHGAGESGDAEFDRLRVHGPIKLAEARGDSDMVILAPQCPRPADGNYKMAWREEHLAQVIQTTRDQLKIDPARVYLTGLSMGGYGTWRLAESHPELFAAAIPICGGGDPTKVIGLRSVPIWAFHGAKDEVVPLVESQEMVDAARAIGGQVKLTVYPEAGHDSWTVTYQNPEIYRWLNGFQKLAPRK